MTATADDYAWFEDQPSALSEAYCLTLARGLSPAEFLARIGAQERAPRTGLSALFWPSMRLWEQERVESLFIGATAVTGDGGAWVLGVEVNGFLGVTEEVIVPVSAGTRLVSHYRNISREDHFYWIEDQDIRLSFRPDEPAHRTGSTPDAVADVMQEAGFDLREDGGSDGRTAAAFALAERLTGVRVTPGLLGRSAFTCGVVPIPRPPG